MVSAIADTGSDTYVDADVQSLGDPVAWDATERCGEPVDVQSGCASVVVDVAGETGLVLGIPDEEDTFYSVEGSSGDLRHGVDGCGGTLGVSLEDEAFVGIGGERRVDLVDDLQWSAMVMSSHGEPTS